MKFCRQCGTLLKEDAQACTRCGMICPDDYSDNGRIYGDSPVKVAAITVAVSILILVLVNVVVLATADKRGTTFADKIMETKAEVETTDEVEIKAEDETQAVVVQEAQGEVNETIPNQEAIEEAEPDKAAQPKDYTGDWTNSEGMKMSITDSGDGKFKASIKTQISPGSYSVESASGSMEDGAIIYRDAVKVIYVSDSEGNKAQITDYTGGEGYFMTIKKDQIDAAIDYGADVLESDDRTVAWIKTSEPDSITDEYVIWYSSDVKLTGMELVNLTDAQKKLAVDEIKARHGVIFTDESVRAYFEGKSWYKGEAPETYFSEDSFTEIEKANIKLLTSK